MKTLEGHDFIGYLEAETPDGNYVVSDGMTLVYEYEPEYEAMATYLYPIHRHQSHDSYVTIQKKSVGSIATPSLSIMNRYHQALGIYKQAAREYEKAALLEHFKLEGEADLEWVSYSHH